MQEEQLDSPQQQMDEGQIKKILRNVRQNFGKINVAPEFSEEDLVHMEMPELDMSDRSGSDNDTSSEDEGEDVEEEEKSVALVDGETEASETAAAQTSKASDGKSSREVIRELDEKIAKYKQFLDRAKSKHFSAIRSVCSHPNVNLTFSFPFTAINE